MLVHILGRERCICCLWKFCKCVCIYVKTHWDFSRSNPNEMSIAYVIVKTPYDELFIWYFTFAYVYNKLFTFISLQNNWIVSIGNFFIISICESHIVQCKLRVDMWIFTNIQWLLFMNMCWRHFLTCTFISYDCICMLFIS